MDQSAVLNQTPDRTQQTLAYGPGALAWLAPLAAIGVGLLVVTLSSPEDTRWALMGLAAAAIPMLPTSMMLSLIRGPRRAFDLWQAAVAASLMRILVSIGAAAAVLLMTDTPVLPFAWVFLLVAGVGLVSEKLIVLATSRVAVDPGDTN